MTAPYEEALGRSAIYDLLSLAFLYPQKGTAAPLAESARMMASMASRLGWQDMESTLEQVYRNLASLNDDTLLTGYTELFGHSVSGDCPPYEGEYGQNHIFQKSQTLADLNTFYKAFGVEPNPQVKDRLDHISVEMEFMHLLTLKEAYAQLNNHGEDKVRLCREAQRAFLEQHLGDWIKEFATQVSRKSETGPLYSSLAHLLENYIQAELDSFQINAKRSHQTTLPLEEQQEQDCEGCPLFVDLAKEG